VTDCHDRFGHIMRPELATENVGKFGSGDVPAGWRSTPSEVD